MNEIFLHVCCGPCATSSIERLKDENYFPTLFFSNDNIDTLDEFEKRFNEAKKVASFYSVDIIKAPYNHDLWLESIKGLECEKEGGSRCIKCFFYNLNKLSEESKKRGYSSFTTTLSVSRFKNSEKIFTEGEKFEGFTPINFKKKGGFERSIKLSKEMGLYRQNYCGCEFSKNK